MAVLVRNGCKHLGSASVIDNLNMNVVPGSIYGLMGASGCGKTTLLSCIVGLKELDAGHVTVFGFRPGERGSGIPGKVVGFMPQEVALYPNFTISEVLAYYGKIYGMTSQEIKSRTEFLVKFLQLPNTSRRLETLSGGQIRRTSMACAMIHHPPLLVLDEPTVGLDPLLRQSIWEHMAELVRSEEKTTIIITTHYIEEARFCDTVGIMRRGHILAEQNPKTLMALYISDSLESVVLQLCKEDAEKNDPQWKIRCSGLSKADIIGPTFGQKAIDAGQEHKEEVTGIELKNVRRVTENNNDNPKYTRFNANDEPVTLLNSRKFGRNNFNIICSLANKNFILQRRHPLTVVGQVFLPLLQTILYNLVVGTEPLGMTVAYVSKDWNSYQEMQIGKILNSTQNYRHQRLTEFCYNYELLSNATTSCFRDGLSGICTFLNQFKKGEINWLPTTSLDESLNIVQRGDAVGYLEFPPNYTYFLKDRLIFGSFVDNGTLDGSSLKVKLDVSDALSSGWLRDRILKRYLGFINETVTSCSKNSAMALLPLKYNPIYGDLEGHDWIQHIQPSLIIILIFLSANMPGMMWTMEKRLGIADRGTVAGINFGHIVAASFVSDTVVILGQIALFFFMLPIFYGMKMEGSWTLAVGLVFITSLAGLSLGFFWASICNRELDIIMVQIWFSSLMTTSTGGIWPLEAVASWYRTFCYCLPVSAPIASMRAIVFRGWGFFHPVVLNGFVISVAWIVMCLAASIVLNTRKR